MAEKPYQKKKKTNKKWLKNIKKKIQKEKKWLRNPI